MMTLLKVSEILLAFIVGSILHVAKVFFFYGLLENKMKYVPRPTRKLHSG